MRYTSLEGKSIRLWRLRARVFLQFWSGSCRNAASFVTQSSASESPDACCSIPPTMQVCTHSYRREMAGVVDMSSVIGGWSFFTRRGSCGERWPNYGSVNLQCLTNFSIAHQLDQLYKHPIIRRCSHQTEKLGSERKIARRLSSNHLTQNIDGGSNNT